MAKLALRCIETHCQVGRPVPQSTEQQLEAQIQTNLPVDRYLHAPLVDLAMDGGCRCRFRVSVICSAAGRALGTPSASP
jgi:hypothetical protein